MDGLDLLKQHWHKDNNFPQVDKEALRGMLHKSSSSIVKWIFLISILELALGIILSLSFGIDQEQHSLFYDVVYTVFDLVFYTVICYFIYSFFNSYRQIKSTNNTKVLLGTILKTRQHVDRYIRFNMYCIIFSFVFISIDEVIIQYQERTTGEFISFLLFMVILSSLFCWVFLLIVKLYYRILYRRLVKKLTKNYEELLEIDRQEQG